MHTGVIIVTFLFYDKMFVDVIKQATLRRTDGHKIGAISELNWVAHNFFRYENGIKQRKYCGRMVAEVSKNSGSPDKA